MAIVSRKNSFSAGQDLKYHAQEGTDKKLKAKRKEHGRKREEWRINTQCIMGSLPTT